MLQLRDSFRDSGINYCKMESRDNHLICKIVNNREISRYSIENDMSNVHLGNAVFPRLMLI